MFKIIPIFLNANGIPNPILELFLGYLIEFVISFGYIVCNSVESASFPI